MKKIYFTWIVLMVALCLAACEKTIEFDGEESEPRLTVSALARAGEPFTAYVSSSVFFLNNQSLKSFTEDLDVSRGTVRVTVNGTAPVLMHSEPVKMDGSFLYACDYVPQPGDHIVLEAEFPDFDPVRAETSVPLPPRFEVTSLKYQATGQLELEMTLVLYDDGSYEKYYCLVPKAVIRYEGMEDSYQMPYLYRSDDIVFKDMGTGVFEMYSFLFGDDDLVSCYFSDELIRGKEHEIRIVIPGVQPPEENHRLFVDLRTVTESLYWYDVSYAQLNTDFSVFSEGVTLYSNVVGGYGVLCASATTCVEIHF